MPTRPRILTYQDDFQTASIVLAAGVTGQLFVFGLNQPLLGAQALEIDFVNVRLFTTGADDTIRILTASARLRLSNLTGDIGIAEPQVFAGVGEFVQGEPGRAISLNLPRLVRFAEFPVGNGRLIAGTGNAATQVNWGCTLRLRNEAAVASHTAFAEIFSRYRLIEEGLESPR